MRQTAQHLKRCVQTCFTNFSAGAAHEGHPLGLHIGMIIPTIKNQATEEQQKKWLPLAESYRMIATYAQTELGHG